MRISESKGSVGVFDKIKGGLFGLAVGDALGSTLEFLTKEEIENYHEKYGYHTEIVGGGFCRFEKGEVTDDTDMTLCVARGIIKNPFSPIEYIGEEFVKWMDTKPKDAGLTIRYSISKFFDTEDWEKAALQTHKILDGKSAGNGSLMRCLPIALVYSTKEKNKLFSKKQSKMTHYDDLASEACVIYNQIASDLLQGVTLKEAIKNNVNGTRYEYVMNRKPTDVPDGYVVNTLQWSLYVLLHTKTFEEAVQMAVNFGYDADTTGAVVGGLAGIYYGFEEIPKRYIEVLLKKEEIDELASQLFEVRNENNLN